MSSFAMPIRPTVYAPDGQLYSQVLRIAFPNRAALDVSRALIDIGLHKTAVDQPDWRIAEYLGALDLPSSRRYVQKGLKTLEDMGLIYRDRIRKAARGATKVARRIYIYFTVRQGEEKARKVKATKAPPPKKLPHDIARPGAIHPRGCADSSLLEVTDKEKQADATDVGHGSPSSSSAGEEGPALDPAEAERRRLELIAQFAAVGSTPAAPQAARTAQERPAPPRPDDRPSAPSVAPRAILWAQVRAKFARDVEDAERRAAGGDEEMLLELEGARIKLAQHDARRPPDDDPPGVGSAPPIADPPA